MITTIQNGIVNYFNNNDYIKTYQDIYNQTNNEIIKSIDDEINELKSLRNTKILILTLVHIIFCPLEMKWIYKIRL